MLFGPGASDAIRDLLEIRSIDVHAGVVSFGWSGAPFSSRVTSGSMRIRSK